MKLQTKNRAKKRKKKNCKIKRTTRKMLTLTKLNYVTQKIFQTEVI